MADAKTERMEAPRSWTGKVIIEIADARNNNTVWHPTKDKLWGRWSLSNLRGDEQASPRLQEMPDMPGAHIMLDGSKRLAKIFDPLGDPARAAQLARVKSAYRQVTGSEGGARPTKERPNLDNDALKTWLYWIRRKLDGVPVRKVAGEHSTSERTVGGPEAILVEGNVPTLEEIMRLPGRIRTETFNNGSSPAINRYREDAILT